LAIDSPSIGRRATSGNSAGAICLNRLRPGGNPAFDNWHSSPFATHPRTTPPPRRPRLDNRSGKGIDNMLTYRTYTLAAVAAALAATAIASLPRNDAEVPKPNVQTQRSHQGPGYTNAQAAYLPDLFVEEERAARIDPMPPQF
jgi:hypothetical protein